MAVPNASSAISLSEEVGISKSQLSRYLGAARNVRHAEGAPSRNVVRTNGTARSTSEKARLVMAAAALSVDELGAFLRREGVHEAELERWRAAPLEAGRAALQDGGGAPRPASRPGDTRHIKDARTGARPEGQGTRGDRYAPGAPREKCGRSAETRTTTPTRPSKRGRHEEACAILGITERAMQRWREDDVGDDERPGPHSSCECLEAEGAREAARCG